MKKILLYTLLILVTLSACRKEDDPIFPKSADERLNEELAIYNKQLTESQYGWKAMLFPKEGGYFFHFKFNDKNAVSMLSDVAASTTVQPNASTWRLKALQRPTLMFDTYSYLHLLADPDPDAYGGVRGKGFYSDFEFSFESVKPDTIRLTGNFNNSELILVKATKEDVDAYSAGKVADIMGATDDYIANNLFPFLKMPDGKELAVNINVSTKVFALRYLDDKNEIQSITSAFVFTPKGIFLKTPIKYGNSQFQEVLWDAVKQTFYVMVGTTRIDMESSDEAIIPLHLVLGTDYSAIVIIPDPLPGQSPDFIEAHNQAIVDVKNTRYRLDLKNIFYLFDRKKKTMTMDARVFQGANQFQAVYTFDWVMDANGVSTFVSTSVNGNGGLIVNEMMPLLGPLLNDHFKLDFFNAGGTLLGGMYSQETPGFYFTGFLLQ